jgi:mannose-6-phosphate isomerase-like protein (cupin superfamily)
MHDLPDAASKGTPMTETRTFSLADHVIHFGHGGDGSVFPAQQFWESDDLGLGDGPVVSQFETESDWPNWEMHPAGDEIIVQLVGAMTLVLDREGEIEHVTLEEGSSFIVPRGTWHTANAERPGRSMYITYGEGTQNRPRD